MGCPQSKPELEEDRTYSDNQTLDRDSPAPLSQPGRGPPSASKPMTMGAGRGGKNDGPSAARSYTEHRIGEEDFFESIIKRTENQLINANEYHDELSASESANTSADYNRLQKSVYNRPQATNWTALPAPANDSADPADDVKAALEAPLAAVGEGEAEAGWLPPTLDRLTDALGQIAVTDPGEVVAFLPEFPELARS